MTSGRRQDDADPDGLLTSEDLFGDLVDGPLEPSQKSQAPVRKGPIRVQVSEPGLPRKEEPASTGKPQVLPEDVAVLLEAFAEPSEAAPIVEPAGAAPAQAALQEEPRAAPAVDEPQPAPPPSRPAPRPGTLGEGDAERLLEALQPSSALPAPAPQGAPSSVSASVPPQTESEAQTTLQDEAERWLAAIQLLGPPPASPPASDQSVDAPIPQLGAPHSATTAKFQAAAPRSAAADSAGLDLAAVAEDALGVAQALPHVGPARPSEPSAGPEPPAAPAGAPASQYGPYRLLQKVAVGGMAEVFKAKRSGVEGFEKVVAVKRILPHLSDNKEFVDMFVDEAKMVAGLTHPNIVQISDLGKIEKSYYIAMEFVHGRDLRSIQKRAKERGLRIPLDLAVLIVSKVCSALEYAHRKKDDKGRAMKIVHRDISPQNILISFEGDVKLTDFGIAKAATKASTTDRGALRGKLLYMSPEQAWGKPIDRRSDIFSLGIVFHELITEEKAFLGSSEMNILEMVRECRIAPPGSINPRVPESLERVVMKALERDPDVRYQNASEMYKDLERVLHERRPPAATELARLMELLFDEAERGDAAAAEERSGDPRADGKPLEIELDAPAAARGETATEGETSPVPREPLSVEQLLKRFGSR